MDQPNANVVIAKSRAKYNEGYMPGFGNNHSTQAEDGALPIGRNSPQRPPLGLYAEQISGTAFTAPRAHNRRNCSPTVRLYIARHTATASCTPTATMARICI